MADYKSLVGKLTDDTARFTPPCIWHGLVEVATEVAKKKVSGLGWMAQSIGPGLQAAGPRKCSVPPAPATRLLCGCAATAIVHRRVRQHLGAPQDLRPVCATCLTCLCIPAR